MDKKTLIDFFPSMRNQIQNLSRRSDYKAELSSHAEILNQSALLSISDLKGNIIHANELFCSISKYSIEEVLNQSHNIIRHPETPCSVFKDMWSTIGNGKVWQGEIKNRAKDGSDYWVIATVAPVLGANKKPIKYISIRFDITKQKLIEEELRLAKKKIDNELLENIIYAKYIHSAFLSDHENMKDNNDSFLIYKAQKMISGDFYKIEQKGSKLMLVVGDSTGHGISASYISVLVLNILIRALENNFENPDKILRMVNSELNRITHFNKEKQLIESADMIACCIDKKLMKLTYASAKMRAFIIRAGESILLEKDKCTIGEMPDNNFKITTRNVDIKKGDSLYIISDGIVDQIGGIKNKCIGFKRIRSLIKEIQESSMTKQKEIIEDTLIKWQNTNEQTDDITILGIRI